MVSDLICVSAPSCFKPASVTSPEITTLIAGLPGRLSSRVIEAPSFSSAAIAVFSSPRAPPAVVASISIVTPMRKKVFMALPCIVFTFLPAANYSLFRAALTNLPHRQDSSKQNAPFTPSIGPCSSRRYPHASSRLPSLSRLFDWAFVDWPLEWLAHPQQPPRRGRRLPPRGSFCPLHCRRATASPSASVHLRCPGLNQQAGMLALTPLPPGVEAKLVQVAVVDEVPEEVGVIPAQLRHAGGPGLGIER